MKLFRKVTRPTIEELLDELETSNYCAIGRKYGVSDNAIKKWCKAYGIEKPPRGYWEKLASTKVTLKCPICNKEFLVIFSDKDKRRYCSVECMAIGYSKPKQKV